jgi:hypothetical protein
MDNARDEFTFRTAFQHSDLEYVNLRESLKQTGNRGVNILETLLCEQLSLTPFRQIAIPWMNLSREPFDTQTDHETVDSQYVFGNSAARR